METGERLIAGAMSGTSGDGVDVAIVRVTGKGLDMKAELVRHHHVPFDSVIRDSLFAIRDTQQTRLSDLAKLGREISLTYARAVNDALGSANLRATDLSAVAAHGQTLYHDPPNTIQWFDPSLVAAEVGCAVISDFRRADCAAGGQGAPLVPFADYILFRHPTLTRVLLNIGGIANISLLKPGGSIEEVIAFDTGPGNCVSDYLCRTLDPQGPGFDLGGARALRGTVREDILRRIPQEYALRLPPKSTDGPAMISAFCRALMGEPRVADLDDLLATACRFTADEALGQTFLFAEAAFDQVVVAGGGALNARIMSELQRWITESDGGKGTTELMTTDALGIPSEAREAIAFALLGAATLDQVPSNIPKVTGARRTVVLGSITPKP